MDDYDDNDCYEDDSLADDEWDRDEDSEHWGRERTPLSEDERREFGAKCKEVMAVLACNKQPATFDEAKQWVRMFQIRKDPVDAAAEWIEAGWSWDEAIDWVKLNCSPAEATAWEEAGWSDMEVAADCILPGRTPREATEILATFGMTPPEVCRIGLGGFCDKTGWSLIDVMDARQKKVCDEERRALRDPVAGRAGCGDPPRKVATAFREPGGRKNEFEYFLSLRELERAGTWAPLASSFNDFLSRQPLISPRRLRRFLLGLEVLGEDEARAMGVPATIEASVIKDKSMVEQYVDAIRKWRARHRIEPKRGTARGLLREIVGAFRRRAIPILGEGAVR